MKPNLSRIQLWSRLTINQRGAIALSIPLFCVIVSLGSYVWMRQSVQEAQGRVDHTNQVLLQSRNISVSLLNAESSVRGYYISRQTEFLEPYSQTNLNLPQSLIKLKELVEDNPIQAKRSREIEQFAQQRMARLATGIAIINNNLVDKPADIKKRIELGRQTMGKFNTAVEEFETEELRLLDLRRENFNYVGNFNTLIIWCGAIISVLGTAVAVRLFKNLTKELNQRELNLRDSRNLIQTITANIVDGVVVINRRSQIESLNNAALKMFGYTSAEIVGQKWQILIEEDSPLVTNHVSQSRGIRQKGAWFPIEISISTIEFDQCQLLIIRDITDRQKAAVQLQSRADELAKLNHALISTNRTLAERNLELDQFAYIVSHDLKAPLRAIANLSEWLEADLDGQLPAESQTQLRLLRSRVYRMYALLNGILEYSRIGRTKIDAESVSVEVLLAEILETLAPHKFKVEFDPLPTFITSRLLLRQVFTNLIDNAIKYHPNPHEGCLRVSVQELDDYYEFGVSDNGNGIDPKFHQKVFTIFQTLEARDIRESTGIGLAIVKKIVETAGGKIQLKSEVGKGSTFYFTWRKNSPIIS